MTKRNYCNDANFGDIIASKVVSAFEDPNIIKGKPRVKSNGVKEWTVLSGIVSVISRDKEPDTVDLISVSTGVKALPDDNIKSSNGKLLHDCHAEILSLRCLNRFIVEECINVQNGLESLYIEVNKFNGKPFKLRKQVKFALYVSELPCGDCSMESLYDESGAWESITEVKGGVIRGRDGYKVTGRVRTKPGRRDSPITLSKSCSDKLCITQLKSLLNGITSRIVELEGFYLNWLVVPQSQYHMDALDRSFNRRFTAEGSHKFNILTTDVHHEWENKKDRVTSSSTLIYIPSLNIHESVVNFVREGFYSKKKFRTNGESVLSRYQLFKQISLLLDTTSLSYIDFKKENKQYVDLKIKARECLQNWCHTSEDDFTL